MKTLAFQTTLLAQAPERMNARQLVGELAKGGVATTVRTIRRWQNLPIDPIPCGKVGRKRFFPRDRVRSWLVNQSGGVI